MAGNPNPYLDVSPNHDAIKLHTLPISETVTLFGPEIDVIATDEFQRLDGIKQLGTSYVVYRGAKHTRWEHSLGSLHQAELMLRAIEANPRHPYIVAPQARRLARLGALLHDVPHVPFGHTLEDELHLLKRHDANDRRKKTLLYESPIATIIREALGDDEFEELWKVLDAKKEEELAALRYPFVGDLVGNTLCADLLDYVQRDLEACGLPAKIGYRFLDYLSVAGTDEGLPTDHGRLVLNLDKRGMPRPDVESEVAKLLTYRYELAERVYFHHAKNAASVMIGRAVQEAGLATGADTSGDFDDNFLWLSDDLLLHALENEKISEALGLQTTADHDGDRALASELAEGVLRRDLYKIAYLATRDDAPYSPRRIATLYGDDPERRRAFEDEFADAAGIPRGKVLVHVPRHQMMSKAARLRVRVGGEVVPLEEYDARHSRRLAALNEAHERLWRVMVFVHPEHASAIPVVRGYAEDYFLAGSRYGPARTRTGYQRALFDELTASWDLAASDLDVLAEAPYTAASGRADAEREILRRVRRLRKERDQAPLTRV